MKHRKGADKSGDIRFGFDRRVRLEFHGSKISSDGGLVLFGELDEVLGLHDIAGGVLKDTRPGHNRLHSLVGRLRQSVFGRLAGYDDVNDADRPALDPVMRQVVGGRAVDATAASASQMGRFETEVLATTDNRTALTDVSGHWIDRVHERNPPPGSHWTWTVPSARPTAHRRAPPGRPTLGSDTRFIVTNFPGGRAKHLCETVYCARGRMENLVKEHKLDLRSDRTSCHRREANRFRIFLHTAAYGLMLRRRGATPKKSQWRNATFETIRNTFIKIAARGVQMKTRIRVSFPTATPSIAVINAMLGKLAAQAP